MPEHVNFPTRNSIPCLGINSKMFAQNCDKITFPEEILMLKNIGTMFKSLIINLIVLAALFAAANPASAAKLRILHYNDNHARIESQDITFNSCEVPATCFGGFAKQQTFINQERKNANSTGTDMLLVHAGDQLSGTFWDILFTSKGNFSAVTPFLRNQAIDAFTFVRLCRPRRCPSPCCFINQCCQ